jgi:hypothetical protein
MSPGQGDCTKGDWQHVDSNGPDSRNQVTPTIGETAYTAAPLASRRLPSRCVDGRRYETQLYRHVSAAATLERPARRCDQDRVLGRTCPRPIRRASAQPQRQSEPTVRSRPGRAHQRVPSRANAAAHRQFQVKAAAQGQFQVEVAQQSSAQTYSAELATAEGSSVARSSVARSSAARS